MRRRQGCPSESQSNVFDMGDGEVRSFGKGREIKEGGMGVCGVCVCVCVCVCGCVCGRAKGWDSPVFFVCGMCFCVVEFPGAHTHFSRQRM